MPRTRLHPRPPRPPRKLPDSLIMPSPPTIQPTAPDMEKPLIMSTATHAMTLRKRNNHNAKPPPRKQKAKRCFRLMDLPLELRFQVYHYLLSAGYVSLLRVSRTVFKEASSILFFSACFRNVVVERKPFYCHGPPEMITHPHTKPGQKTCCWPLPPYHLMQHVSFRIDLHFIDSGLYEIALLPFLRAVRQMRRKKCCRIVFERAAAMRSRTRDFVIHFLKQFQDFEEVIVTVTHDHALFELALGAGEPPVSKKDSDIDRCVAQARNGPLYDIVKQEFEPRFGPSVCHDGLRQADSYVAFYPVAHEGSVEAEEVEE